MQRNGYNDGSWNSNWLKEVSRKTRWKMESEYVDWRTLRIQEFLECEQYGWCAQRRQVKDLDDKVKELDAWNQDCRDGAFIIKA